MRIGSIAVKKWKLSLEALVQTLNIIQQSLFVQYMGFIADFFTLQYF